MIQKNQWAVLWKGNVAQLWSGFLQETPRAPEGWAAPPPAFPGALTALPAMSLGILGEFGISVPFWHHCHDRVQCVYLLCCMDYTNRDVKGSLTTKVDTV